LSGKVRVAIAGVGNCASSLVQGVFYYNHVTEKNASVPGLMHNVFGGYKISDIEFVAAFDVDKRKVGKDLSRAIFEKPNCTTVFNRKIPDLNVPVQKAPVLDGVAGHFSQFPEERRFFVDEKQKPVDVEQVLRESTADVLINYMPVGSQKATEFYASACLNTGIAMVNCMPVFIASNREWSQRFTDAGLPIVGDDIKSQFGATIVHRVLAKLASDRGIQLRGSYQLNVGGNTDFLNMKEQSRLASKKISKTESVQSQLPVPLSWEQLHVGPSDYVPFLNDNKVCFLRLEGNQFGDVPMNLELRLSVEDSPNSAGVVIDALRAAKIGLDRKIAGPLLGPSAYFMKHPPVQYSDEEARKMVENFILGKEKELSRQLVR
jgi:myo-inositol-1-phosphate synthase